MQLVSKKQLCKELSISQSTLDKKISLDLNFPKPMLLGERTYRYDLIEVIEYLKKRQENDCNNK